MITKEVKFGVRKVQSPQLVAQPAEATRDFEPKGKLRPLTSAPILTPTQKALRNDLSVDGKRVDA